MQRLADRIATSDDPPCAIADCANAGRPQICPYDEKYHHHGRIHYDTILTSRSIGRTFRDDGWHYICDGHYAELNAELEAHRIRVRYTPKWSVPR